MEYDLNQPLEPQVDREMARRLSKELGYDFSPERTDRIAASARSLINAKYDAASSFAEALELELMLYGDPLCEAPSFTGLIET